ncbi:hypothetical protein MP228_000293 [Amoeboaphelidium protococcarum]|nr:hypothetical protein MP228_000293 [Amoeboaphelidium protococcarum]
MIEMSGDGACQPSNADAAVVDAVYSMHIDDDIRHNVVQQHSVSSVNSDDAVGMLACRLADHVRKVIMNGREDKVVRYLVCLCECLYEFRFGDIQCRKSLKRIHFPSGNALMPALAADLIDKEYRQFLANSSTKIMALVVEQFMIDYGVLIVI